MPRVVHFEIHATDPEALIAFYSDLFGWAFTPAEGMDYWIIATGPTDEPGIDGGLVRRPRARACRLAGPRRVPLHGERRVPGPDAGQGRRARRRGRASQDARHRRGVAAYIKDPDGNVLGLLESDSAAA